MDQLLVLSADVPKRPMALPYRDREDLEREKDMNGSWQLSDETLDEFESTSRSPWKRVELIEEGPPPKARPSLSPRLSLSPRR
jgi:hypothetical protein